MYQQLTKCPNSYFYMGTEVSFEGAFFAGSIPKKVVFVFTWHWNVRLTFVNHETLLKLTSLITFLPLAFLCFYWLLKRHFLKVYSVNWKIHYTKTCCLKVSLISRIAIIYRSRGVFRTLYILSVDPNPFSQQIEQSIKQIFELLTA